MLASMSAVEGGCISKTVSDIRRDIHAGKLRFPNDLFFLSLDRLRRRFMPDLAVAVLQLL